MIAPANRAQANQTRLRQKVENVVATVGELVGGATAAIPGAVVGGLYAAESQLTPEQRHTRELGALLQAGMSVASSAAQQSAGQWLLDLPTSGLSLSNWSSALAGSAWQYYSGGCGNIAEGIFQAVDRSESNPPGLRRVAQGMTKGFVAGAKGGAYEGRMQGLGLVDGVIEGGRDAWQVMRAPSHENAETIKLSPPSRLGQLLVDGAGMVGAAVGATLGALDGTVQGGARGLMAERRAPDLSLTRHRYQVALATAVGGAFLFGPAGAACGALLGQWAGRMLPQDSALDQALTDSFANDSDLGDHQANTYRNTVEGGLVGCAAGARSGMKIGKQNAQKRASLIWERLTTTHKQGEQS
ncbi:hypothetical protein JST97_06420 [bacterium]|nr:hypothetical protein [bacterium]